MDGNGVDLQNVTVITDSMSVGSDHDNPAFNPEAPPPYNGVSYAPQGSSKTTDSLTVMSADDSKVSIARRRHKSEGELADSNHNKEDEIGLSGSQSEISDVNYEASFDEANEVTLIYSRHEKLPKKNFSSEVRALMDVRSFLKNTVLLLDVHKVGLDAIIEEMLHKMLDGKEDVRSYDQARSALFTHDYVHQLSRTLQCTSISEGGGFDYDQNYLCAMCSIPLLQTRRVGIARLHHAVNLGPTCQEVHFVIVVLTNTKEKGTKTELETGRTFGTIFADIEFRQRLMEVDNEGKFNELLWQHTKDLSEKHFTLSEKPPIPSDTEEKSACKFGFLRGIRGDLARRLPHYVADYKDGLFGHKSLQKTISTTLFLYFACILPCIAFGVLNFNNTNGVLGELILGLLRPWDVEKVLYSQIFGGLIFAIVGGTPQIVLLTTAPLALYTKIIYSISKDFDLDFRAMYCCVGLWNSFFMFVYSCFDLSVLMEWSSRSSEEIFALFISIAFSVDAFKNVAYNFEQHYYTPACMAENSESLSSTTAYTTTASTLVSSVASNISDLQNTSLPQLETSDVCERDISMLYLLLLFGTLWLGLFFFNFTKTPYLTAGKREMLADYALPASVIIMAFFGGFVFKDVELGKSFKVERTGALFEIAPLQMLSVGAIFGAMGLGFCLSLLFFMDQNISAALVNAPQNKMKKGTSYHWDLLVIGVLNGVLSIFTFPWVHAALPHSPLHVRALADVEERVDQGHIYQIIVKVRETRLTGIFSHILIGLSMLILPILAYIPIPVLYGLFLYLAVTALSDNQMFERIMLLATEQNAYPPNHFIRRVPQRKMHFFTLAQMVQLGVLCLFGFFPYSYLKMFFPVLIFALIPIRHKVIPLLIEDKYLKALDGH